MNMSKVDENKKWPPQKINREVHVNAIYSLFKRIAEEGYTFPGESHGFWECVYIYKGSENCMSVTAGERIYEVGEGNIVFHKPYELHKFYATSECEVLIFSFNLFGKNIGFYENKLFKLNTFQRNIIENMISYADRISIAYTPDSNYHKYLIPLNKVPTYSQMIITYIYQLLLSLTESNSSQNAIESDKTKVFYKAIQYMERNIKVSPSVDDIADACNVSVSTLKRIFGQFINVPVHKYFLEMKLNEATRLLCEGQSVCSVAKTLGFSSQAYFSNLYKRERNIAPSEVKKNEE